MAPPIQPNHRSTPSAPPRRLESAPPAPEAAAPPAPRGDEVSLGVTSTRLHDGWSSVAAPRANEVRTVDDYRAFVGGLEEKYPDASGFDLNRAVRQHFYSDEGQKNTHGVFDSWLGTDGGRNDPRLAGIEGDLQGLPSRLDDGRGGQIDLSHLAVGADTYYERNTGQTSWYEAPVEAAQGFALTHGGDYAQTAVAGFQAFTDWIGLTDTGETFASAANYASDDQIAGNSAGLAIGGGMEADGSLSSALRDFFGE